MKKHPVTYEHLGILLAIAAVLFVGWSALSFWTDGNDEVACAPAVETPPAYVPPLTFYPTESDFEFSIFYLGATQAEVRKTCERKGGTLAGVSPEELDGTAITGAPFPVCFFDEETKANVDGYYPVYWPKN